MMFREAKLVALALFHTFLLAICAVNGNQTCRPSSCGEIQNISNPFRLKGDPSGSNVTSSSSQAYVYALVGDFYMEPGNLSMSDLQEMLLLGLELSFLSFRCKSECWVKGLDCERNYSNYTL
ncbi:hypothetical protein AAG906_008711 [Vitis piasezkii]